MDVFNLIFPLLILKYSSSSSTPTVTRFIHILFLKYDDSKEQRESYRMLSMISFQLLIKL